MHVESPHAPYLTEADIDALTCAATMNVTAGKSDQVAEAALLPGASLGLDDRYLHALREKV
jgi:hypothetical protein